VKKSLPGSVDGHHEKAYIHSAFCFKALLLTFAYGVPFCGRGYLPLLPCPLPPAILLVRLCMWLCVPLLTTGCRASLSVPSLVCVGLPPPPPARPPSPACALRWPGPWGGPCAVAFSRPRPFFFCAFFLHPGGFRAGGGG